jgi:uncharacterized membrane protein YphA (DoxX/SURF4 family)
VGKVDIKNGLFIKWGMVPGKGHGYEANIAYIAMAVACVLAGGGALSIDGMLIH